MREEDLVGSGVEWSRRAVEGAGGVEWSRRAVEVRPGWKDWRGKKGTSLGALT
jgi:hypothetical protein